jgi:hypothetical protein
MGSEAAGQPLGEFLSLDDDWSWAIGLLKFSTGFVEQIVERGG